MDFQRFCIFDLAWCEALNFINAQNVYLFEVADFCKYYKEPSHFQEYPQQ